MSTCMITSTSGRMSGGAGGKAAKSPCRKDGTMSGIITDAAADDPPPAPPFPSLPSAALPFAAAAAAAAAAATAAGLTILGSWIRCAAARSLPSSRFSPYLMHA